VAVNPPPCVLRASVGRKAAVVETSWRVIVVSPQSFFVLSRTLRRLQTLSRTCCISRLLYCPSIRDIPSSRLVLPHMAPSSYGLQICSTTEPVPPDESRRTAAHKPNVCSTLSWR
jgi:hypothetical protein